MIGSQTISDLITNPDDIKSGFINIIEANVSAGKTHFALNTLPQWAGGPNKILYLIDTNNGELSILKNILTVNRQTYSLHLYGKKANWGEICAEAENNMPVMTYAGFGSEVRRGGPNFHWLSGFSYIVCDEMQNLVNYQKFDNRSANLEAAEQALRRIASESNTKIIALSATTATIREHFSGFCRDVPFDRTNLRRLETFKEIPYSRDLTSILKEVGREERKKGILYVTTIGEMEEYMRVANKIGIRAKGFWSINARQKMSEDQLALRATILEKELIPADVDLLVINAASQTCIKIQSKLDYIIVHDKRDEVKTQVRGRYNGDLARFYYHDVAAANISKIHNLSLSDEFIGKRLYFEDWTKLCHSLALRKPHGGFYSMPTVAKMLIEDGYSVEKKKDSSNSGKWYYVIRRAYQSAE